MKEAFDDLGNTRWGFGKGSDGVDGGKCLPMKPTVLVGWQSRQRSSKERKVSGASYPVPGPEHFVVIHAQKACLLSFCIRQVGIGGSGRGE